MLVKVTDDVPEGEEHTKPEWFDTAPYRYLTDTCDLWAAIPQKTDDDGLRVTFASSDFGYDLCEITTKDKWAHPDRVMEVLRDMRYGIEVRGWTVSDTFYLVFMNLDELKWLAAAIAAAAMRLIPNK